VKVSLGGAAGAAPAAASGGTGACRSDADRSADHSLEVTYGI